MYGISTDREEKAIEIYLLQMLTATWRETERVVFYLRDTGVAFHFLLAKIY